MPAVKEVPYVNGAVGGEKRIYVKTSETCRSPTVTQAYN